MPMSPMLRPVLILAGALAIVLTAACEAPPLPTPPTVTLSVPIPVRDEAVIDVARDVFVERLMALGMSDITTVVDDLITASTMTFVGTVPAGFDLEVADAVLRHPGVITFVPWPAGANLPEAGDQLPEGLAPLFDGSTGFTGAEVATDGTGQRAIDITLGPAASEALGTYTTGHVGEVMALALDGIVLAAPTVSGPITGGVVRISVPNSDPISLELLVALLDSGPLPAAWSGPA